jgi:glycosyltransferase involved in cell wall biosynthesis
LKISIITVCYNAGSTLEDTIKSVINQDYENIEYILVDGKSSDNTSDILSKYEQNFDILISEKDNGIYDAINKGIRISTGEIIGILNADDVFYNSQIISLIAKAFKSNPNINCTIGDIVFQNESNHIVRKYSSKNWSTAKFEWGYMPPHPSFYCKRKIYFKYGLYNTNFKIAADYELLIRFLEVNKTSFIYLPMIFVKMKVGGVSTRGISSFLTINREVLLACRLNGLNTNHLKLLYKYFNKIFEYIYIR